MPLLISLMLLLIPGGKRADPRDFTEYVAQVRSAGATEYAQGEPTGVAEIILGQSIVDFPKEEDGTYPGTSYTSATCPPPGASEEEQARLEEVAERKQRPVVARLKEIADTDHSGFVSTMEAASLRDVVLFGLKAGHLARKETSDPARLREFLSVSEEKFRSSLESYARLLKSLGAMSGEILQPVPIATTGGPGA